VNPAGRLRAVFIGTGDFGVPALRYLARDSPEVDVPAVVTAPARPAGRSAELRASPVTAAAVTLGLPTLTPDRLRRDDAIAAVLALRPDLIVLADYGQLVPSALLGVPFGALNLHPSLLPRHRGAIPVPATIVAGDPTSGVSLMRMNEGLDTGPIVAVDAVALAGGETTPELEALLAAHAADLLDRSLGPWIRGEREALPQPNEGATLTRQLRRDDGRLDPRRPAVELERQVRAFQPWPGSWLPLDDGSRLAVWRARVAAGEGAPAGRLRVTEGVPSLATAAGELVLIEVQPAAGRRMSGEAFARGRRGLDEMVEPGPERQPIERPVGYSPGP
jgi:methionyl-tRNA formyltransferase